MQLISLHPQFDALQKKYGDKNLNAIYGAGCTKNPDICFVFMNPTAKNTASSKKWRGIQAPWIGTKNVWKLFVDLGLFDQNLNSSIQTKKPNDWNLDFAKKVYQEVENKKLYITNLSKATQKDAHGLPNSVFKEYLPLLRQEIDLIKPKVIISFGNQVSSILLGQSIKVSECRKKKFPLKINNQLYATYPVYYPLGQGMRNIAKAIEDIEWVLKNHF